MLNLSGKVSKCILATTLLYVFSPFCFAEPIAFENSSGETYVFEVRTDDSFENVMAQIGESVSLVNSSPLCYNDDYNSTATEDANQSYTMNVCPKGGISVSMLAKKQTTSLPRDYSAPIVQADLNDITYIIRTLSNESLIKIKKEESSLKRAGDRVDHVHPLQFLLIVFGNEELKVGIRNIQGRSWVGKSFIEGLTSSLSKENGVSNVLPYAQDFANKLNLDVNIILPYIQAGQWDKFVNTLIKSIPRQGNHQRYDM